jgi:hypothetical protein
VLRGVKNYSITHEWYEMSVDGVLFSDLTILDAAQHGIQLVELQLTHVYITEKIASKGLELLGRFHQPLQDSVGVHLEHPGSGANT